MFDMETVKNATLKLGSENDKCLVMLNEQYELIKFLKDCRCLSL